MCGPGSWFGEESFVVKGNRTSSATTLKSGTTRLLTFNESDLEDVTEVFPAVNSLLMRLFALRAPGLVSLPPAAKSRLDEGAATTMALSITMAPVLKGEYIVLPRRMVLDHCALLVVKGSVSIIDAVKASSGSRILHSSAQDWANLENLDEMTEAVQESTPGEVSRQRCKGMEDSVVLVMFRDDFSRIMDEPPPMPRMSTDSQGMRPPAFSNSLLDAEVLDAGDGTRALAALTAASAAATTIVVAEEEDEKVSTSVSNAFSAGTEKCVDEAGNSFVDERDVSSQHRRTVSRSESLASRSRGSVVKRSSVKHRKYSAAIAKAQARPLPPVGALPSKVVVKPVVAPTTTRKASKGASKGGAAAMRRISGKKLRRSPRR